MKERLSKNDLDTLTNAERAFYQLAVRRYRADTDWFTFEDFAFGMKSPIYERQRSHLDVLQHPLYLALREMWLDLGVKQGMIAQAERGEKRNAPRRRKARSGKAIQESHSTKARHVAAADSSADERLSKSRR
jgi:hypothetical protein